MFLVPLSVCQGFEANFCILKVVLPVLLFQKPITNAQFLCEQIPLLIIREGMSGTAAIRWSVSGVDASRQSVDDQDVAALAGTINIESGQWLPPVVLMSGGCGN